MNSIKTLLFGVVSAALICGCGKPSYDKPLVPEGSVVALGVKMPTDGALKKVYDDVNKELWSGTDASTKEFLDFLKNAGFNQDNFRYDWALLTSSEPILEGGDLKKAPNAAVVMSIAHDIDKVVKAMADSTNGQGSMERREYDGNAYYALCVKNAAKKADMESVGVELCIASMGGKLIVISTNEETIRREIDLYVNGKGKSSDFADFTLADGDLARLSFPNVGKTLSDSVGADDLAELDEVLPDGGKIVSGLRTVSFLLTSPDPSALDVRLIAETAMPEHAQSLADVLNGLKQPVLAQAMQEAKRDADAKKMVEALKNVSIVAEDKVFKISAKFPVETLVDAIGGVM